jgi:hypothetical protein
MYCTTLVLIVVMDYGFDCGFDYGFDCGYGL